MSDLTIGGIARKATGWSIAISIVLILAGILAIALPLEAGIAVNLFVAWMLVFASGAHFVFAWITRKAGGVLLKILLGILYLVIAIYLLDHPARGLATLTLALAFYLVIEGVLEVILFFQHRKAGGAGWYLFDGVVTLILGFLVWKTWPSSAEWVIGTLVGISMMISGITRLMFSVMLRKRLTPAP
ncbi:MAG TPA: DUF308 domain-containing protein [Candidatus Acidoferrum sp.]|nr:DUF308 domain-containing protein [Candidatus Acidoferrum sp.]